jgi:hypothetical protein
MLKAPFRIAVNQCTDALKDIRNIDKQLLTDADLTKLDSASKSITEVMAELHFKGTV